MFKLIKELISYGIRTGLIEESEEIYTRNLLLDLMQETGWEEPAGSCENMPLEAVLGGLLEIAEERGIIEDGVTSRDLFDTRLMNCLMPRPAQVRRKFEELYRRSPREATDWYYRFSQDTNYIRRDRAKKDLRWKVDSPYGSIDITINLAKPEKDPRDIENAAKMKKSGYPACQLCPENEGYAGHAGHPARQNLRVIPLEIEAEKWYWQYSPYGYYNEHCIAFSSEHRPMRVDRACFAKLLDFVGQYPHYFIGSNADLPVVGGSILSHEHFQGGNYEFAMAKAGIAIPYTFPGFEDVEAGIVKWPLSVLRLRGTDRQELTELAGKVLDAWREHTDETAFVLAKTGDEPHNTITPIARMTGGAYELDLVLRNNIRTEERPMGLFHPSPEYHHIKKENIGLIEVMGLAVLPARLKAEMGRLAGIIAGGSEKGQNRRQILAELSEDADLLKHMDWAADILNRYRGINKDNIEEILKAEIGSVFVRVLEDAGVYKWNQEGHRAFLRFLDRV